MTIWSPWTDRAACLGEDPELFFPVGSGAPAVAQIADAKRVCRRCPVARQCADTALANGYEGVWGGLDDNERRRLRRGRVVGACHRPSGTAVRDVG